MAARLADRRPRGGARRRPATSSSTRSATTRSSWCARERGELAAFHNACRHRGTRLADGCGAFANGEIRCPYHAWTYALDGRLVHVPDREEFVGLPDDLGLRPVRVECWGGFVFVNMDLDAEPLLDFLDPLPDVARAVPVRRAALPHVPHDDHRRELEGRRRRVQRELPRAGAARADPAVDRRHEHRLRAVRTALALRPAARRASRAAAEPAPRPAARRLRRRRDPRRARRRARAARSSARSAKRSPSCARRDRRRARRCSARTRSGA